MNNQICQDRLDTEESLLLCRKSNSNNLRKIIKQLVKEVNKLPQGKTCLKQPTYKAHVAVESRSPMPKLDRLSVRSPI